MRQAFEAGACGYLLKNILDLELVSAIERVAAGEIVLDPQVSPPASLKGERDSGLSARELEVLQLIVEGKSNKEIAKGLNVAEGTVKMHLAALYRVLGATNRAHAAALGRQLIA